MDDLTLEKLEISKKISVLEVTVGKLTENITLNHGAIQKLLERHDKTIFGDGNGRVGLHTRVDRLEQVEDMRKWHFRSLWVSLLGLLAKVLHLSLK